MRERERAKEREGGRRNDDDDDDDDAGGVGVVAPWTGMDRPACHRLRLVKVRTRIIFCAPPLNGIPKHTYPSPP